MEQETLQSITTNAADAQILARYCDNPELREAIWRLSTAVIGLANNVYATLGDREQTVEEMQRGEQAVHDAARAMEVRLATLGRSPRRVQQQDLDWEL
jgi:hypothetical protein